MRAVRHEDNEAVSKNRLGILAELFRELPHERCDFRLFRIVSFVGQHLRGNVERHIAVGAQEYLAAVHSGSGETSDGSVVARVQAEDDDVAARLIFAEEPTTSTGMCVWYAFMWIPAR